MINYTIFYHRHLDSVSTCSQILNLGGKRLDFFHAYNFPPTQQLMDGRCQRDLEHLI